MDDREDNLIALAAVMETLDVEVVRARSGLQALEAMLAHDFAVVLLDVGMPGMDGFDTAALIKQHPRCGKVPIIFVTASIGYLEQSTRGYEVGAADYLPKPLVPQIVRAKVSVFVELYRQREQIKRQGALLQEQAQRERQLLMERAEAALTASEAQYEATARQAPFGLGVLKSDGTWLKSNHRCTMILQYKRGTLPSLIALMAPDQHRAQHAQAIQDLEVGRRDSYRAELQLARADGATIWASLTMTRLFDEKGSPVSLVLDDITTRKKGEQYQAFLSDASETLLSSLDYKQTLRQVARDAVPILGDWCAIDLLKPNSRRSHELTVLHTDPSKTERVRAWRQQALWDPAQDAPRVPWNGLELYESMPEDTPPWEAATGEKYRGALLLAPLTVHGRILGTLTFGCDTPARNLTTFDASFAEDLAHRCAFAIENALLFEETQQAVRARDDFLSVASHELRTPLTPLSIQLQRLVGTRTRPPANLTVERTREILQRADRHVQRLATLIDNLLDVSRVTSGRFTLDLAEADMCEVVRDVAARHIEDLSNAGSKLQLNLPAHARGFWDRSRLDQVITNLLTNAIKYGGGKDIEISIEVKQGRTLVSVRDHGIGVPPEKRANIFERFERAVSTRDYAGLGLGLFIARQILEAHGGTIHVQSDVGVGSCFVIDIPTSAAVDAVLGNQDKAVKSKQTARPTPPAGQAVAETQPDNVES